MIDYACLTRVPELDSVRRPAEPAPHPQTQHADLAHELDLKGWALFNPDLKGRGANSVLIQGPSTPQAM
jgi:hypothetical protein